MANVLRVAVSASLTDLLVSRSLAVSGVSTSDNDPMFRRLAGSRRIQQINETLSLLVVVDTDVMYAPLVHELFQTGTTSVTGVVQEGIWRASGAWARAKVVTGKVEIQTPKSDQAVTDQTARLLWIILGSVAGVAVVALAVLGVWCYRQRDNADGPYNPQRVTIDSQASGMIQMHQMPSRLRLSDWARPVGAGRDRSRRAVRTVRTSPYARPEPL